MPQINSFPLTHLFTLTGASLCLMVGLGINPAKAAPCPYVSQPDKWSDTQWARFKNEACVNRGQLDKMCVIANSKLDANNPSKDRKKDPIVQVQLCCPTQGEERVTHGDGSTECVPRCPNEVRFKTSDDWTCIAQCPEGHEPNWRRMCVKKKPVQPPPENVVDPTSSDDQLDPSSVVCEDPNAEPNAEGECHCKTNFTLTDDEGCQPTPTGEEEGTCEADLISTARGCMAPCPDGSYVPQGTDCGQERCKPGEYTTDEGCMALIRCEDGSYVGDEKQCPLFPPPMVCGVGELLTPQGCLMMTQCPDGSYHVAGTPCEGPAWWERFPRWIAPTTFIILGASGLVWFFGIRPRRNKRRMEERIQADQHLALIGQMLAWKAAEAAEREDSTLQAMVAQISVKQAATLKTVRSEASHAVVMAAYQEFVRAPLDSEDMLKGWMVQFGRFQQALAQAEPAASTQAEEDEVLSAEPTDEIEPTSGAVNGPGEFNAGFPTPSTAWPTKSSGSIGDDTPPAPLIPIAADQESREPTRALGSGMLRKMAEVQPDATTPQDPKAELAAVLAQLPVEEEPLPPVEREPRRRPRGVQPPLTEVTLPDMPPLRPLTGNEPLLDVKGGMAASGEIGEAIPSPVPSPPRPRTPPPAPPKPPVVASKPLSLDVGGRTITDDDDKPSP